jgi:RNA polymerase sigma-70 factor (ECF subfamily)
MNDTDLMLQLKNGDETAFRTIVEKHQDYIFRLAFRYLTNHQDAEEITQDVFIKLYQSRASYKPRAKLSTYLYRITINLSLNRIRDRKRKNWISLETLKSKQNEKIMLTDDQNPEKRIEQKEKQQFIKRAIGSLPNNQQTALILKRFEDLSYQEIAEVMETSVSAVEALLHRAKQNLQKKLKPLL